MGRNKPPAVRLDMLEPHAQPAANPRDSRGAIEKIAVRTIYACTSGHLASEWCRSGRGSYPLPIRRAVAAMTLMNPTHFGFQSVDEQAKAGQVRAVFDSVAPRYDLMNDLMSAGLHRVWKACAVLAAGLGEGSQVLDIAGG